MGRKEDFWDVIDVDLPENIADLLDVTIDVSGVSAPADVDAAIIEQGKLAAKLNKLLDDLQGLSLVELALRIGQKNVTSKLMLLSALEYTDKALHTFDIEQPQAADVYQYSETDDIPIRVVITDGEEFIEGVSCDISEGVGIYDLMQDEEDPSVFTGEIMLAPNMYVFTFTATFTDTDYQPGKNITVQVNEQP